MRATKSRVGLGFVGRGLPFAELPAARLDPLNIDHCTTILSGLPALPFLEDDRDGADDHGKTYVVIPFQRLIEIKDREDRKHGQGDDLNRLQLCQVNS